MLYNFLSKQVHTTDEISYKNKYNFEKQSNPHEGINWIYYWYFSLQSFSF